MDKLNYEISVIIPMYNSEKTICKTIESILKQTYYNYIKEIIVVDDGSTDNGKILVENIRKNNSKVKLIFKQNGGVASARNLGMKHSSYEWLAFCDSDDIWVSNKIEKQINVLKNHPEIDFLGTKWIDKNPKIFFKEIKTLYKASIYDICISFFPQPSTVIMKREIYEKLGGFESNQRYAEEGYFFCKICKNYNYFYLPSKLINYGYGKHEFADEGLSVNLKEMHQGNIKNIRNLKDDKLISSSFYYFLLVFYNIKYLRRILIKIMRDMNN